MKLGDEFINVSAGGGGWGDPLKRDPLKIVEDVLNGFVQRGTASEIYGVDVDMDGSFTVNVRRRPESPERSG
jgi:N-methylhydantoinase B